MSPELMERSQRVSLGMTQQEVGALIGPSVRSCWNYARYPERTEVCFRDGAAINYGRWYGDDRGVESWWEETRGPIPSSWPVQRGDRIPKVQQVFGEPAQITGTYAFGLTCLFVHGRLVRWNGPLPYPPVE
jgi:hypothetical protein